MNRTESGTASETVGRTVTVRSRVEQYLAMRRSLGFKLHTEGRMLLDFADRLDEAGQSTVTVEAAVAWACAPSSTRTQWGRRLGVVRSFARHLKALDSDCEVPPVDLLAAPSHRPTPYLYSAQDVAAVVHAAGTIAAPLHAATMQAVIGLIAATGLRLGEALGLDRGDVDLDAAVLKVSGKNDQTRLLPIHPTTVAMLGGYAARRDRLQPHPRCSGFFLTSTGRRVQPRGVQQSFAKLLVLAEVSTPPGRLRPRIHDLRHTFAVNILIGWYRDGVDVPAHLPVLSTFLGHASPEATYWYLQAAPALLALAAQRLEHSQRDNSGHLGANGLSEVGGS